MTRSTLAETAEGVSIGAVLHRLRDDFPDLTVSKIRFLETEGLIRPLRRDSGYRTFSAGDVDRLRFVLTAQRDRFWPLRVIKDVLDRLDRGLPVPEVDRPAQQGDPAPGRAQPPTGAGSSGSSGHQRPDPSPVFDRGRRMAGRMSPAELRTATGLDMSTYSALTTFGLLQLDAAGRHGGDDLEVAREAAALAAYGIEARHLRLFRVAADREIGLAEQVLEPLRRRRARGAAGADPAEVQAQVLAHGLALHTALVRSGLSRTT